MDIACRAEVPRRGFRNPADLEGLVSEGSSKAAEDIFPPKCTCSAKEPGATFPSLHATDCPEFIDSIVERRVPRYDSAIQLVEVDGVQARYDTGKGILIDPPFGPWPRKKPGDLTIDSLRLGTLLQAALDLLSSPLDNRVTARNLIKIALDEITVRKADT
jgi:hypothetical protein